MQAFLFTFWPKTQVLPKTQPDFSKTQTKFSKTQISGNFEETLTVFLAVLVVLAVS